MVLVCGLSWVLIRKCVLVGRFLVILVGRLKIVLCILGWVRVIIVWLVLIICLVLVC